MYKYLSFSLLLLAEAFERFSYYFVSFVVLFYLMTNTENGGLGFSQENAMKIGGYFSLGILLLPVIFAPFVDRKIGYIKATHYGGVCLAMGYFFALISSYFFSWMIFVSLALCLLGSAFLKPTMSVLVAKLCSFSKTSTDIAYILFVMIVNVASLSSAYASAKMINQYGSFKPFFIIATILMLGYLGVMLFIGKKNQHLLLPEKKVLYQKESKNILVIALILCLFIGMSTTISAKIFSFPASLLFWSVFLFGIVGLFFIWNKTIHQMKKMRYLYLMISFFLLFLFVNLFTKEAGSISPFFPSLYFTFDMLLNFFIFPLMLSIISRFAPQNTQATFQAFAFLSFSISAIVTKNYLPILGLSSVENLWLLAILSLSIVGGAIKLFLKLEKTPI